MTRIIETLNKAEGGFGANLKKPITRGSFLKYAGASAAATGLFLAGCKKDDDNPTPGAVSVDLGTGDYGILNYAYLLEQLEAAFYTQVTSSFYSGVTDEERTILNEIAGHEQAHRDFFKAALGTHAIAAVTFDFSSINFTDRASVLGTAKVFEDLGVSAYNGAGHSIESPDYLLLAGKIVSVEARHASAIRDLLNPFSADFAGDDTVDGTTGLDASNTPTVVLTAAKKYVKATVTFASLPA